MAHFGGEDIYESSSCIAEYIIFTTYSEIQWYIMFHVQVYFMNVFSPDMMGSFLKGSVKS